MDWNGYEPYDPGVFGPLHEQTRAAAKAAFEKLMRSKVERMETLARLMNANGLELDASDSGIQKLDDWFQASVEQDPNGEPGQLRPMWYSVVNDVALFLGDAIIERAPNLEWKFFTFGKRDLAYQRHVIMGFPVANSKYNVDVDRNIAIYGHRIVAGESNREDYFVYLVENAVALALGRDATRN
jgi:hypothetical protein